MRDKERQEKAAQIWSQRFRDPMQLVHLAEGLLATAERHDDRAFAHLQLAWGHRYRVDSAAAEASLARAREIYELSGNAAGLANCRDLQATLLAATGEVESGLALLRADHTSDDLSRSAIERVITHDRCGFLYDLLGKRDESLRHRYAMLDAARASGDIAAIAFALAILGGVHADLYSLDVADQLCSEGLSLADSVGAIHAWSLAALNHMNALLPMERYTEAVAHAERLLALEPKLNQRAAEQRMIVYADAFASVGDAARAQSLLDRSISLRNPGQQSLISFTCAQVRTWNASGAFDQSRALGERYLADPNNGSDPAQVPTELLRILQALAFACEAQGDLAAALRHQKNAFAVHESLVGQSARARRLTLEIQHRLDRERWEREHAQRRQREAEVEGERLNLLNRQLDSALQTRTRFLAAASHDLRQPAHALALYATALEQETSRAALNELAKRMRATVGSLSNMFDGLLELARLDAGAIAPQFDPFDLSDLLDRLCIEYRDRLTSENAVLRFRKPRRACWVASDAVMVERIFRNLIGNAVKYSAGANVMVAVRRRSGGMAIEIRDGGPGMSDEEQRRVFDEFFRAKSAASQRDGLGLGLSIVDRFAKLLGFAVSLRSQQGAGTTFSVLIPPASLSSQVSISQELAKPLGKAVKRRLFVIDDDADARESMALVLSQWGHECLAAASAAELLPLASVRGFTPDALISDFQLTDSTAIESIRQVRSCYGDALPVLVVSGSHDAEAQLLSVFPDAAYLPKPVRPLRLKSWIANVRAPGA